VTLLHLVISLVVASLVAAGKNQQCYPLLDIFDVAQSGSHFHPGLWKVRAKRLILCELFLIAVERASTFSLETRRPFYPYRSACEARVEYRSW
jgi:hypothetical protein